jgi:hypothetical protein
VNESNLPENCEFCAASDENQSRKCFQYLEEFSIFCGSAVVLITHVSIIDIKYIRVYRYKSENCPFIILGQKKVSYILRSEVATDIIVCYFSSSIDLMTSIVIMSSVSGRQGGDIIYVLQKIEPSPHGEGS